MTPRELELALEAASSAHRDLDRDGRPMPPPSWFDLPPDALDRLYLRQAFTREMERAADARGRSATVAAVLARIGD